MRIKKKPIRKRVVGGKKKPTKLKPIIHPSHKELRGRIVAKDDRIYISSTSLGRIANCSMQYALSQKLRLKDSVEPAAFAFGRAVHEFMAGHFGFGINHTFVEVWKKEAENVELSYRTYEKNYDYLLEVGRNISHNLVRLADTMDIGLPYNDKEGKPTVEYQTITHIGEKVYLVRTFDLIAPVGGVPSVIDWKTAYRMYKSGVEDLYSTQMTAYLLDHNIPGVPQPEIAHLAVAVKNPKAETALFSAVRTDLRKSQFIRDMLRIGRIIRQELFVHNRDKFKCGYCEFQPLCFFGNEAIGLYETTK